MRELIDREAVIDLLKKMRKDGDMVPWEGKDVFARIRKLPTIQPEKAQLSYEDTTSDLISRTETVEHLRRVLDATVPITDYDEGYVDGIEFGISTVSTMPSAQPEPHEGEWEQVSAQRYFMSASYFYRCSACGVNNVRNTNYCPNCGAKMKGERQK